MCQGCSHGPNPRNCSGKAGSSPRLRGTDPTRSCLMLSSRFIPAPAGNRSSHLSHRFCLSVHPRACGEQISRMMGASTAIGSSPRLRGTEVRHGRHRPHRRFIPAPAGNRALASSSVTGSAVHPRACGEQMVALTWSMVCIGSSPRLRGTGVSVIAVRFDRRFIPAPAGNSD